MKTLIYGAGPIGRWLALRLGQAGRDVTLLARTDTSGLLKKNGVVVVDGYTGERQVVRVSLVDRLDPGDRYDLVVVPMRKSSRVAVCPILAANQNLENYGVPTGAVKISTDQPGPAGLDPPGLPARADVAGLRSRRGDVKRHLGQEEIRVVEPVYLDALCGKRV